MTAADAGLSTTLLAVALALTGVVFLTPAVASVDVYARQACERFGALCDRLDEKSLPVTEAEVRVHWRGARLRGPESTPRHSGQRDRDHVAYATNNPPLLERYLSPFVEACIKVLGLEEPAPKSEETERSNDRPDLRRQQHQAEAGRLDGAVSDTKRRHHYVPRLYLRGFASDCDPPTLWIYDKGGRGRQASTRDVGLKNHYYSLIKEDGSRDSNTIENALAKVESEAASALTAIRDGDLVGFGNGRLELARFIAYQLLRVPVARRKIETMLKAIAGSFAGREFANKLAAPPRDSNLGSAQRGIAALETEDIEPIGGAHVSAEDMSRAVVSSIFDG
jgi:hypothetical protein